jgi:hypothetical protein
VERPLLGGLCGELETAGTSIKAMYVFKFII